MKSRTTLSLLVGLVVVSVPVLGCLWDRDRMPAERAAFPEVPYLITGSFPRHSREYYEWLKARCETQIKQTPHRWQLYDDLAVAQHKLGDHHAAVDTMLEKEKIRPGLYETYSNLGTFLIYTGELDAAVEQIRKALAINANAHFGREKYQKWLVEWVLERRQKVPVAGSPAASRWNEIQRHGFAAVVAHELPAVPDKKPGMVLTPGQQREALKGVSGMMRFADFDNPLLLEALGDLLVSSNKESNAPKLAALCYLHAAMKASTADEAQRLNARALVLSSSSLSQPAELSEILKAGIASGSKYAEDIRKDEIAWIAADADVSAEFQKKYLPPAR